MSEYLPAGVTDAHPHFNPPRESATAVECGADEALVIPAQAVKAALIEISGYINKLRKFNPKDGEMLMSIGTKIALLQARIDELGQEREYECPFKDEVDLEESECARWDCPVCGNDRETDNLPEDRDPDEERYDYDD
jgi:hypothetical protein